MNLGLGPVNVHLELPPDNVRRLLSEFYWQLRENVEQSDLWTVSFGDVSQPTDAEPLELEFGEGGSVSTTSATSVIITMARTGGRVELDRVQRRAKLDNPDPQGLFIDTYRFVRQLMISELAAHHFSVLHSSAIVVGGQAVAFIGMKGAGKTTMASQLALRGASFLANDKLFVDQSGRAVHFPESPAATRATLLAIPELDRQLRTLASPRSSDIFLDHPELPTVKALASFDVDQKVFFSEREWATLHGCQGSDAGQLVAIVEIGDRRAENPEFRSAPVDIVPHSDKLEPFPDWTGTRGPAGLRSLGGLSVPAYRFCPTHDIFQSGEFLWESVLRLI